MLEITILLVYALATTAIKRCVDLPGESNLVSLAVNLNERKETTPVIVDPERSQPILQTGARAHFHSVSRAKIDLLRHAGGLSEFSSDALAGVPSACAHGTHAL